MDLIDVRIRLQFLPLSERIRDPFKLVESMEKGVASLPILNMTGESLLLGNCCSHVHRSRNRMISTMDGKEKHDNQEILKNEDRDGDSPG